MHLPPWVGGEPCCGLFRSVRRTVVEDHVDLEARINGRFDRVEERTEVDGIVTWDRVSEDLTGANIERGDQFGDAMTAVLEFSTANPTWPGRLIFDDAFLGLDPVFSSTDNTIARSGGLR